MNAETCPETIYRGGTWDVRRVTCGKPVKRNGLCGVHARKVEQAALRRAKWEDESARHNRAVELADQLGRRYAIPFKARGETVTLSVVAAEKLLAVSS